MRTKVRRCGGAAVLMFLSACATMQPPLVRQECFEPDVQLAKALQPLEKLRASGCTPECERLRNEIERLAAVCPTHEPTLLANAVIAFDGQRRARAQQFLDQILSQSRSNSDAVVLRARIATEDGNLPYARRLLEQQIKLVPDHAGLHETFGGVLFLERQLAEARRELMTANGLGAPRWRIAYHLGLIDEAEGQIDAARKHYTEALEGNPGWAPAQSRLNGLPR